LVAGIGTFKIKSVLLYNASTDNNLLLGKQHLNLS
jgi:hypothetical protein